MGLPNMNTEEMTSRMSFTGPAKLMTMEEVLLTRSRTEICLRPSV